MRSVYARLMDIKALFRKRSVRVLLESVGMGVAAFLLSRAGVLEGRFPFGVAFMAAAGSGMGALFPFAGAILGYLSAGAGIGGMRYLCALPVIFIFGHAMRDQRFTKRLAYPAIVSFITMATIGITFVMAGERSLNEGIMALCEACICAGAAYFYRIFLRREQGDELFTREGHNRYVLSGFVFAVTCLIALEPVELVGVSLGRVAASVLVLLSASGGGFVGGAVGGVLCGFAMDLAAGNAAHTMIYAVAGMVGGVFSTKDRFFVSAGFVVVNAACALWLKDSLPDVSMALYEAFAASVIVMLLPQKVGQQLSAAFHIDGANDAKSGRIRDFLVSRMNMAAEAFDRVADAFKDDASRIETLTVAEGEDARRFNREKRREAIGRILMREQYNDTADIFRETATKLLDGLRFDTRAEEQLKNYMSSKGIEASATVFRDAYGHLHAELFGSDLSDIMTDMQALRGRLKEFTGTTFGAPRIECGNFGNRIHLDEIEQLAVTIGVAIRRKNGERVSGDSGSWFKDELGRLYVLLSDGMGSGPDAARESSCAIRIVETLIKAQIAPAQALKMLNSTLYSRGENICTTVDLLILDMFTGDGVFYKYGAAPSYVLSDGRLHRVTGGGFPAGGRMEPPERTRLHLGENDVVVLTSDGVGGMARRPVSEFVSQYNGESAKDFAVGILKSVGVSDAQDDMTVMVIKTERRGEN